MSSPPNKLSSYRSYSYYHVLAVCDSTDTASKLAKSTDLDVWKHSDASTLPLGKYSPKPIVPGGGTVSNDLSSFLVAEAVTGKYCILINGATDATFSITTVNIASTTAGGATPEGGYTSIALEGSIDVSEPKGVVFLDQIIKCCVELGVDSSNATFVLKTFFIGFGFESTVGDFVETISDVAPLMFTVTEMTGSFTESGGLYHMGLVACVDGTARLPQYGKLGSSVSMTGKENLKKTLEALEKTIQDNYNRYYGCVEQQVKAAFAAAGKDSSGISRLLSRVTYKIEVSSDYDNNRYVVVDQPEQVKTKPGCSSAVNIQFQPQSSIEDCIRRIMLMTPEVVKDMSEGDPNEKGRKYEFRIRTAVQSAPSNQGVEYTVYYRVERFMRPKDVANAAAFGGFQQYSTGAADLNPILQKNIIKFDYIYTGKNIDILDFDIKVNAGLAYLQCATQANVFRGQTERSQRKLTALSSIDLTQFARGGKVVPMPVYFGSQIRAPALKNTQSAVNTIQAAYTLAKHASIEVQEATVKIVGNMNLLNSVAATSSPEDLIRNPNPLSVGSAQPPISQNNEADFKYWGYLPAFVKIKIKMPRNNDDIALLTGAVGVTDSVSGAGIADYAQDFWFDGYYYVLGIDHTFDSGTFTQTLHLLGITPDNAISALAGTTNTESVDLTQKIDGCYDNNIGAGTTTPTAASSQPKPVDGKVPSGGVQPTNLPTTNTVNQKASSSGNLSNIKGWDESLPIVKQAIQTAAAHRGVDVFTLAQIASHESRLNPKAKNPKSTASGLFQIIYSTWKQYFPNTSNIFDPIDNADAGARFTKSNITYLKRRTGVEPTVGDLYLAHFLGGGVAASAIILDNRGAGNTSLQDVYRLATFKSIEAADKAYNKGVVSNGSIFPNNNSAHAIRLWAAQVMAKTLKEGTVPVAGQLSKTNSTKQPVAQDAPKSRSAGDALASSKPVSDMDAQQKKGTGACCNDTVNTTATQSVPKDNRQPSKTVADFRVETEEKNNKKLFSKKK